MGDPMQAVAARAVFEDLFVVEPILRHVPLWLYRRGDDLMFLRPTRQTDRSVLPSSWPKFFRPRQPLEPCQLLLVYLNLQLDTWQMTEQHIQLVLLSYLLHREAKPQMRKTIPMTPSGERELSRGHQ